ncbi:hypothetical protein [Acidimangrovimonas sediminis]|uniref:hypothetical protein n=1 Tax=Acidimangrovimonas sediminis TaxID=2056283 RepID=UPI000C7F8F76|nr:hypothetical protein [Acidimangrovimonas sediminis]
MRIIALAAAALVALSGVAPVVAQAQSQSQARTKAQAQSQARIEAVYGPVYQALERQGFTRMRTISDRNQIRITAQRGKEVRHLVYDRATGQLLWDSLDPKRDRTRDRIYLHEFDRDQLQSRDMDRDMDRDQLKDSDMDRDRDRLRDPTLHQ